MKTGCFIAFICPIIFFRSAKKFHAFYEIAAATVKHTTFEKIGTAYRNAV